MAIYSKFEIGSTSGTAAPAARVGQVPLRALVVDDSALERRLHTWLLTMNKFEVVQVTDGRQAVELHLAGEDFDLILIDDRMRVMEGAETVKTLRELGVNTVIVGVGMKEYEEALMNAGVNKYVVKPLLDMDELLREFNFIA